MEKTKKITSQLSSVKKKSFSNYSWMDVKHKLGRNAVEHGDIIPGKTELGNKYVDNILQSWKKCPTNTLYGFDVNEAERKWFIALLLNPLPIWDKFDFRVEFPIKNALVTGILDFAITTQWKPTPLVLFNEAKDYDLEQELSQAYLLLQSCYESGKEELKIDGQLNLNTPFYMYGIVTTISTRCFIRYDGTKWVHSEPVYVEDRLHRDGVKKVISNIYNILLYQYEFLKNLK